MGVIYKQYYSTPAGELVIASYKDKICLVDWRFRKMRSQIDARIMKGLNAEFEEKETGLIGEVKNQLDEYFREERKVFNVPLEMIGTEFQQSVWNELLKIPFGKTESYIELSRKLKNEKAIRAVASANGANAISILVPCHRIHGSSGELIGYAGGLKTKRYLLNLEKVNLNPNQGLLF